MATVAATLAERTAAIASSPFLYRSALFEPVDLIE
jgi:hypothetical protein